MAHSTYYTCLYHAGIPEGSTNTSVVHGIPEKVADIKDFPDLGGAPEMLESTTFSDKMQTYIAGIQSMDALEFTANYTKEVYDRIKRLEGATRRFLISFGEMYRAAMQANRHRITAAEGGFVVDGEISVYVAGAGVNEVVEMKVVIAPSAPIEPLEATPVQ